jgi:hypothetical protein
MMQTIINKVLLVDWGIASSENYPDSIFFTKNIFGISV